ncbi:hypothetical protein G6F24_018380 [Rhizopus arrhizus]|nr:hypothetical protein G6F24_018380 [Rhizopus arrhizus]
MFHRIAFVAQVQAQQFGDVGVIFNYQHASGRIHVGARASSVPPLSPIHRRGVITNILSLREDSDIGPGEEWLQRQNAPETRHVGKPRKSRYTGRPAPGWRHPSRLVADDALDQCASRRDHGDERLARL